MPEAKACWASTILDVPAISARRARNFTGISGFLEFEVILLPQDTESTALSFNTRQLPRKAPGTVATRLTRGLTAVWLCWCVALQPLGAQAPQDTGWTAGLRADVHFARSPSGARPLGFAGGARLLSTPSNGAGVDQVVAYVAHSDRALTLRLALQAGDAVGIRADRAGMRGSLRALNESSVQARLRTAAIGGGVFPSTLSLAQEVDAPDAALSPSMLRDFMPWRHAGAWARVRVRMLEVEAQALSGWEFTGDMRPRGAAARADLRLGHCARLRGYLLRAPHDGSPMRRLSGATVGGCGGKLAATAEIQLGSQENSSPQGRAAHWWSYVAAARWEISRRLAWAARFERFDDDKQIGLATGASGAVANAPMRGYSETIGIQVRSGRHVLWRVETRAFQNSGASFPGQRSEAQASLAWLMVAATMTF